MSTFIDLLLFPASVHFSQEPSSIEKVAEIDEHIGVAMSGLTADARTLIDHGECLRAVDFLSLE